MDEYTQLDDEEMEAYLIRRSQERERDKERPRKEEEKKRSFRWTGGMC